MIDYQLLQRRHNAACPRCYGPAYRSLGVERCERDGGCLVEREPRVALLRAATPTTNPDILQAGVCSAGTSIGPFFGPGVEHGWFVRRTETVHALLSDAVSAWRADLIWVARVEAVHAGRIPASDGRYYGVRAFAR